MASNSKSAVTESTTRLAEKDDPVLSNLQDFIVRHGIYLSPSLSFRRVPGRGVGVYSTTRLRKGERIMDVPSSLLLTTASIPFNFAPKELRSKLPVHVLLAVYLAFGVSEQKKQELQPWMATWPKVQDFTESMCLFWPEKTRKPVTVRTGRGDDHGHGDISAGQKNKTATTSDQHITFRPVPQTLTGSWLGAREDGQILESEKPKFLDLQLAKFQSHIALANQHFPTHLTKSALSSKASQPLTTFTHAWANVNSRCFYHVAPGKRAPKDSNEAMAMVPAMDLFNHSHMANCNTSYDRKGFHVVTEQAISAGQELLLSYGAHSNDTLWTEYGFIMDPNGDDSIRGFDEVVLDGLTPIEMDVLEGVSYLGNYTLTAQGLCWRTEVVSWLGILSRNQWFRFIEGTLTPETIDRLHLQKTGNGSVKRRKGNNTTVAAQADVDVVLPSARARDKQIHWLTQLKTQAELSVQGLTLLDQMASEKDLLDIFADVEELFKAQGFEKAQVDDMMRLQAKQRRGMCLQRWSQILDTCRLGIEKLRKENTDK
ncbi:hypothetical protein LTR84_007325 [Exophiala bonariae]|uniref:SET domain-containing protein n=1 Tax=Exophiala bonariae TaxID=1690606 RepID=A0AAV9MXV1_9EURO|nr:hypothetical protein LTR84_007325 [Exophiala bonariae]